MGKLVNLIQFRVCGFDLETVPPEIGQLQNLRRVSIEWCALKKLPAEFCNLQALQQARLTNNQLTELPENFGDLHELQSLNLRDNPFKGLPASFVNLANLNDLDLHGIPFDPVPDCVFAPKNLKALNLMNIPMTELPSGITQARSLTLLNVSHSNLTDVSGIEHLIELSELSLNDNALEHFPEGLLKLAKLKALLLQGNRIDAVPAGIAGLTSLTHFDLGDNQISALPEEMAALPRIEGISIEGNRFESFPPVLCKLPHLSSLIIGGNRITSIPPEIGQLTELSELDAFNPDMDLPDGNLLTGLPSELCSLPNLSSLALNCLALEALPDAITQLKLREFKFAARLDYEPSAAISEWLSTISVVDLRHEDETRLGDEVRFGQNEGVLQPENDLEELLVKAAESGTHQPFLSCLLNAQLYAVTQGDASREKDGRRIKSIDGKTRFEFNYLKQGDRVYLPVFTSPKWLHAMAPAGAKYIGIKGIVLMADHAQDVDILINPGSPIEVTMPKKAIANLLRGETAV